MGKINEHRRKGSPEDISGWDKSFEELAEIREELNSNEITYASENGYLSQYLNENFMYVDFELVRIVLADTIRKFSEKGKHEFSQEIKEWADKIEPFEEPPYQKNVLYRESWYLSQPPEVVEDAVAWAMDRDLNIEKFQRENEENIEI